MIAVGIRIFQGDCDTTLIKAVWKLVLDSSVQVASASCYRLIIGS